MKQYTPLYLRYRPQSLPELVGQEVVGKTLSNAIKYEKIVHAYLFCGPRGTGKTSTARILAKSLNCEAGPTVEPCGKCDSCTTITDGNSLDVVEIDAASHRKVEDAEDLINRVNLGTYGSRYKVYIIDEVHMLTDHAFNALLKTLEEPPKNVIFILATTEDHKVIQTIVSRCQKLDFKPISQNELKKRIEYIAKEEKILIDDQILSFIAKRSTGCLRDAVSLLDQISVLQEEGKPINPSEVYDLFGTVDRQELFKLMSYVLTFDKKNAIDTAEELVKSGKDLSELFKSLVEISIDLAKAKVDSDYKKVLSTELSADMNILDNVNHSHILKIIESLHQGQGKLRFALSQELQFMTQIMTLLDEDFVVSLVELKEQLKGGRPVAPVRLGSRFKVQDVSDKVQSTSDKAQGASDKVQDASGKVQGTGGKVQGTSDKVQDVSDKVQGTNDELPSQEAITDNQVSDLDSTWKKVVDSISSIPTKTLLIQAESYLLKINPEVAEIGVGKDMFLPRLKNDDKKKSMLLNAIKQVTGIDVDDIRYVVKKGDSPLSFGKPSVDKEQVTTDSGQQISDKVQDASAKEQVIETNNQPPVVQKTDTLNAQAPVSETDEFSQAMKDLLGAKQID